MLSAFAFLTGMVFCWLADPVALPIGFPPQDASNAVDKAAPENCLLMISWAGSEPLTQKSKDAQTDEASANDSKTPVDRLLAEDEIQQSVEILLNMIERLAAEEGGREGRLLSKWIPKLLSRPGMIFIEDLDFAAEKPVIKAGAVVRLQGLGPRLEIGLKQFLLNAPPNLLWETEIDGKTFQTLNIEDAFNVHVMVVGDLFVIASNEEIARKLMKVDESMQPAWLSKLNEREPSQRRSLTAYVDLQRIVRMSGVSRELKSALDDILGVSGLGELTILSGIDEQGYRSDVKLTAKEGSQLGALTWLLSETPLTAASFDQVPADAGISWVANLSPTALLAEIKKRYLENSPEEFRELDAALRLYAEKSGLSLEEDILPAFGERVSMYHSRSEGGLVSGFSVIVDVNNAEVVRKLRDLVLEQFDGQINPRSGIRVIKTQHDDHAIHSVMPRRGGPFLPVSFCVTEDQLIVGLAPQSIRAILSRDDQFESLANAPQIKTRFSTNSVKEPGSGACYFDSAEVIRSFYPLLQVGLGFAQHERELTSIIDAGVIPSGEVLTRNMRPEISVIRRDSQSLSFTSRSSVPAIDLISLVVVAAIVADEGPSSRDIERLLSLFRPGTAAMERSRNQLKMIGLAMHNYHDTFGTLPAAAMGDPKERAAADEDTAPLLSWRVHILPFIEEGPLYEEFHLDEPWDSEHNIKLVEKMPAVYHAPGSKAEAHRTNYVTLRSADSPFPGTRPRGFREITDGLSNTFMVVEATDDNAVIWSKPVDLHPDGMHPLDDVVGLRRNLFLGLLCDGSVQIFQNTMSVETFHGVMTRNGREVFDLDDVAE